MLTLIDAVDDRDGTPESLLLSVHVADRERDVVSLDEPLGDGDEDRDALTSLDAVIDPDSVGVPEIDCDLDVLPISLENDVVLVSSGDVVRLRVGVPRVNVIWKDLSVRLADVVKLEVAVAEAERDIDCDDDAVTVAETSFVSVCEIVGLLRLRDADTVRLCDGSPVQERVMVVDSVALGEFEELRVPDWVGLGVLVFLCLE